MEQEFKRCHIRVPEEEMEAFLSDTFRRHNCNNLDDFYASIGYGGILLAKIMPRLKDLYEKQYGTAQEEPTTATASFWIALMTAYTNWHSAVTPFQVMKSLVLSPEDTAFLSTPKTASITSRH